MCSRLRAGAASARVDTKNMASHSGLTDDFAGWLGFISAREDKGVWPATMKTTQHCENSLTKQLNK